MPFTTSSNLDESKTLSSAKGLKVSVNKGLHAYVSRDITPVFNLFSFPHSVSNDHID